MRAAYKLILAIFAGALLAAPTEAQLAKSGKYTGKTAFNPAGGQSYELEKGHVFLLDMLPGLFLNDVAGGFIDQSEVKCPRATDIVDGRLINSHGYCIITDKDGDRAFLV